MACITPGRGLDTDTPERLQVAKQLARRLSKITNCACVRAMAEHLLSGGYFTVMWLWTRPNARKWPGAGLLLIADHG